MLWFLYSGSALRVEGNKASLRHKSTEKRCRFRRWRRWMHNGGKTSAGVSNKASIPDTSPFSIPVSGMARYFISWVLRILGPVIVTEFSRCLRELRSKSFSFCPIDWHWHWHLCLRFCFSVFVWTLALALAFLTVCMDSCACACVSFASESQS